MDHHEATGSGTKGRDSRKQRGSQGRMDGSCTSNAPPRRSDSADDECPDDDLVVAPVSCASIGNEASEAAPVSASSLASKMTTWSSSTDDGGAGSSTGLSGEKKRTKDRKKKRKPEKSSRRKEQKAADAAAQAAHDELRQQLSSLRLPNMPSLKREAFVGPTSPKSKKKSTSARRKSTSSSTATRRTSYTQGMASTTTTTTAVTGPTMADPPTIRILVVADIDLASASALAESAVVASSNHRQRTASKPDNVFDRVDLCIACGPFCRDDDLQPFLKGRQRRRRLRIPSPTSSIPPSMQPSAHLASSYAAIGSMVSGTQSFRRQSRLDNGSAHRRRSTHQPMPSLAPTIVQKRSKEETAALEGLMTAAISQLESIVCRVVFVPGHTDPMSTISTIKDEHLTSPVSPLPSSVEHEQLRHMEEQRLTPNARNIHQGWIPLCPGLGCSGLLYINRKQLQPAAQSSSSSTSTSSDEDEDSSVRSDTDYDRQDTSNRNNDDSTEYDDEDDAQKYVATKTSVNSLSQHLETHSTHHHYRHRNGSNESASADHTMSHLTAATEGTTVASSSVAAATAASSVKEEYDTEFCNNLEKLVKLAPPMEKVADDTSVPNIAPLCSTSLFQSILVTNFHHSINDEDDDSSKDSNDCSNASATGADDEDLSQEESFDPPWPTEHEAFCALPLVQEHVMLEIASGRNSSGRIVQPMELPKGKMRVVLPGSLRERGEFCLVDVAFMKDTTATAAATSSTRRANGGDYRWRVRRTRFHTLNEYL